ncbi:hypothetical protein EDC18_101333 [Natranaerovirga pectinivora]|uniref:Uncharacterized protein n=1 Tax=Natranaerovirga pectinivora TaxID=682400 RepID=A0A4R3MP23_9FIRM|nr:hypothetical protein [Natranaerovirga pectinivora]TCT17037.1 hypothetical protein EDC18_101333 [Natranaerovirga pectinivora]
MAHTLVRVKLKDTVTVKDFWRATYLTDSDLGIKLQIDLEQLKKVYLEGKISKFGSLGVSVPISYFNGVTKTMNDDFIDYDYIKESKQIWEVIEI